MSSSIPPCKVSVIIPYYQREAGILRRALTSVLQQRLTAPVDVQVIVVDDGSPVPASAEAEGLVFAPPFHLTIIRQANGGVAAARNTALKAVAEDTTYIAFLDSDDTWHEGHLQQGIEALEQGRDFYFCDNVREGYHLSHYSAGLLIYAYMHKNSDAIVELTKEQLQPIELREFAAQASTVMYRRSIAADLLFDTAFVKAGEDILFLLQLIDRSRRVCFSPRIMVSCGRGINIYFSNLDWNSEGHLQQVIFRLKAHRHIRQVIRLTPENQRWNAAFIGTLKRKIAFLCLRRFIKSRGKIPQELRELKKEDRSFLWWFPYYLLQVMIGKPLGLYRPS